MHYYRKNIGDYNKRAGRLSLLQNGVYERLRDAIYEREKFPTRADALEWTWASTLDEISCVDFLLARFFEAMPDGRFVDPEIQKDLERYWDFCLKQQAKGGKGGRPTTKPKKAKENPGGFSQEPGGNPAGLFQNPTATLETSNHKPVTSRTTSSASPPAEEKAAKEPDPEDLRLARWMYDLILKVAPKTKEPKFEKWADWIRKMRTLDGHTHHEIAELFRWANRDAFWSVNVLSPEKLREKFATLDAKRRSHGNSNERPAGQRANRSDRADQKLREHAGGLGDDPDDDTGQ